MRSLRAISNLKKLCEEHLPDNYDLEVIDIYKDPNAAREEQIIAAPTLIVWGQQDRVIAASYAQEFAKRIAGAKTQMIERAGHFPHLEQSDAVTKAVRGFLG